MSQNKSSRLYLQALGLFLALHAGMAPEPSVAAVLDCTVSRVLDGDTIDCDKPKGRYRIRLRSIDAPEKKSPSPGDGLPAKISGGTFRDRRCVSTSGARTVTADIWEPSISGE